MCNENTNLKLISVGELIDDQLHFFVDSYQRGYKWSIQNVLDLLYDINDFEIKVQTAEDLKEYIKKFDISNSCTLEEYQKYINKFNKECYCLQPIVVKQKDGKYELIDGQQRLTSIFIILSILEKKNFEIDYKTRSRSLEFLNNVLKKNKIEINEDELPPIDKFGELKKELQKFINDKWNKFIECNVNYDNIDNYHFFSAYITIKAWQKSNENNQIYEKLTNLTKFIWYEIKSDDEIDSRDVFARLNTGKIQLTNAELVKALFLQKGNFDKNKVNLKQLQIASEWDAIEKTLQNNAFWYFIYDPNNPLKYDNRIEYIFDLMKGKTKDEEKQFTFYEFNKYFTKSKYDNNVKPDVDSLWRMIKKYFLTIESWYNNHELYHLIGALVEWGYNINVLKEKADAKTKIDFKTYLKEEIAKEINCSSDDLNGIEYNDKRIKKILLLFNIQTILSTQNADIRFSFNKYKNEKWDVEHIRSQTTQEIKGNKRIEWAIDILEYFTGEKGYTNQTEIQIQKDAVATLEDKEKSFSNSLTEFLDTYKIDNQTFNELYKDITSHFKENEETEATDCISNLALLDATTNRSYKNAMFPIKRKTIIENDMKGVFVPICTKNVFLKSYSKKMGDVMYWKKTDADDYLNAIKETIKDYLKQPENNNE